MCNVYSKTYFFFEKVYPDEVKGNYKLSGNASENGQKLDMLIETVGSI
jgi:hypothetical protein